jgi:uncharacterized membrane protein
LKAKDLFTPAQIEAVERAIKAAEVTTSGELRLYLEDNCKEDLMDRAAFLFDKLNMHKTEKRNGVLIYMAVEDQRFAIIGDAGINAVVEPDFWDSIKDEMLQSFKKNEFERGLIAGITASGKALAKHFPYDGATDNNELSDDIIIS